MFVGIVATKSLNFVSSHSQAERSSIDLDIKVRKSAALSLCILGAPVVTRCSERN